MNVGKVSENILKRSVLKNIKSNKNIKNDKSAFAGTDCAFFTGIVTDEEAECCGRHALLRACNNAWAAGMTPESGSVIILLPEKLREIKLKAIAKDVGMMAERLNVKILDGHTEVVGGIIFPIVTVNIFARKIACWQEEKAANGQYIVMTKWIGMSGGARLAAMYRDRLLTRYPAFIMEETEALEQFYSIEKEAAEAVKTYAVCMNDCSDGGIFAALWQLGDKNGVGLEVNLKDIPVRQETIEVCEFFDINPYKLRSDGALLIVTGKPEELIEALHKQDINATVIGRITENKDRIILSGEEQRFLEEPRQDESRMVY